MQEKAEIYGKLRKYKLYDLDVFEKHGLNVEEFNVKTIRWGLKSCF